MADPVAAAAMATTMQQMQARMAQQENDPVFRPGGGLPTSDLATTDLATTDLATTDLATTDSATAG
jgi:hypothetical protein